MVKEIKVPSPGESISEVQIANWLVASGDYVEKDQVMAEIDSDKATLELTAEESGSVNILVQAGETVSVGSTVCTIDTSAKAPVKKKEPALKTAQETKAETKQETVNTTASASSYAQGHASPAAKKMIEEKNIPSSNLNGTGPGGRITKQDVILYMAAGTNTSAVSTWGGSRNEKREKMSMLRKKISQRLVAVKNETAMLTTFNEVDMYHVIQLRNKYKDAFKEKHGVTLGFMSFFTKAVCEALHLFPAVNAYIDGEEMVFHDYADVGIAVSAPKGLMVPVLRNAEQMSLAQIETEIKNLATKARDGKLNLEEMSGGTFTITNGGVFGSMLSTPIINPPQSAILGLHNIVDRPVALNGKVEIRPIMYLALSYDHRIIDGKESVGFLYKVKEMIENPAHIIFGGKTPDEVLLNL
ncbi:2-oxoglutarate dehydrogenase E2 component (dihydrolipoamide succinyltransferase) [Flavobacteriales bacterium]|nr:Dihydrolipoyllysine-residue succinyltransferase component of 2-oxoglutarate dehydrogenase complex [Flavobacteriales bacterium]MCL4815325.1 2-oxoglutarate dehydrogenase complex dihydrolipoyllysine-residue succinyltransferase [Flavobacteriales bacterium]WKZ74944.1 MAG: 2-oxoglutarate dehydrogenase complex dihydrolipoyllysine-residue succinyltransferase [Vicingaceae bacterium]GIK69886.1 MAG: dihydrolipoyllysine-residue succinyltransferase component of 2-oxoglutarate dehydrogenase complex [Bacter